MNNLSFSLLWNTSNKFLQRYWGLFRVIKYVFELCSVRLECVSVRLRSDCECSCRSVFFHFFFLLKEVERHLCSHQSEHGSSRQSERLWQEAVSLLSLNQQQVGRGTVEPEGFAVFWKRFMSILVLCVSRRPLKLRVVLLSLRIRWFSKGTPDCSDTTLMCKSSSLNIFL